MTGVWLIKTSGVCYWAPTGTSARDALHVGQPATLHYPGQSPTPELRKLPGWSKARNHLCLDILSFSKSPPQEPFMRVCIGST